MGIYIPGMKMPTSCRDCRFCNGQAETDYGVCAWCDVDGGARDADTMQDCPLVPVPPHGRLGDLDALVKKSYEIKSCVGRYSRVVHIEDVKNADTIISADLGKEDT